MAFFDYFSEFENILDVFKHIEFGDILESTDYTNHNPKPGENLMKIAYNYYRSVDDWWVIYEFNQLHDLFFSILTEDVLSHTVDAYWNRILNYGTLSEYEKNLIEEFLRFYYIDQGYTFLQSVSMSVGKLNDANTPSDYIFESSFKNFVVDYMVRTTTLSIPLKIPSSTVLLGMKAKMNNYKVSWSSN